MVCHGTDHIADVYRREAVQLGLKRVARCFWHYRFGQASRYNWINGHCHVLVYGRPGHAWNADAVVVLSDRATKYAGKRINDYDRGGMRMPFSVWGVEGDGLYWGRVSGSSAERREDHPNQLPEVYMARLVQAYSNPGDWILDPFSGSGTLPAVAHALGRSCVAVDVSAESCSSIITRVREGAVRVGQRAEGAAHA